MATESSSGPRGETAPSHVWVTPGLFSSSFHAGRPVRATLVGESKSHYVVEFSDYSYVNFEDHSQDVSYMRRMRVRKRRCIPVVGSK